jgi:hypothetical protein
MEEDDTEVINDVDSLRDESIDEEYEEDISVSLNDEEMYSAQLKEPKRVKFRGGRVVTAFNKNIKPQGRKRIKFTPSIDNQLNVLHRRYGHLSEGRLKLAYRKGLIKDSQIKYEKIKDMRMSKCPDCLSGRMKSMPMQPVTHHNWDVMNKVAVDYKGPFKVRARDGGCTGFYLFSDYSSDLVYSYPVRSKSGLLEAIKAFKRYQQRLLKESQSNKGAKMFILQSDVDSVARSDEIQDWMMSNNISLQLSTAYKHAQNGQIERDMQNVIDRARTFMFSYDVPASFWYYAIDTACWFINRSPTSKEGNKTPYEIVTGIVPDIDEMIPFYCPGMYQVSKEERLRQPNPTWQAKAKPCRFLGHDEFSRGFIIYDIQDQKTLIREDVIFDESFVSVVLSEIKDSLRSDPLRSEIEGTGETDETDETDGKDPDSEDWNPDELNSFEGETGIESVDKDELLYSIYELYSIYRLRYE